MNYYTFILTSSNLIFSFPEVKLYCKKIKRKRLKVNTLKN